METENNTPTGNMPLKVKLSLIAGIIHDLNLLATDLPMFIVCLDYDKGMSKEYWESKGFKHLDLEKSKNIIP